jgi:hypothetical protein
MFEPKFVVLAVQEVPSVDVLNFPASPAAIQRLLPNATELIFVEPKFDVLDVQDVALLDVLILPEFPTATQRLFA